MTDPQEKLQTLWLTHLKGFVPQELQLATIKFNANLPRGVRPARES